LGAVEKIALGNSIEMQHSRQLTAWLCLKVDTGPSMQSIGGLARLEAFSLILLNLSNIIFFIIWALAGIENPKVCPEDVDNAFALSSTRV